MGVGPLREDEALGGTLTGREGFPEVEAEVSNRCKPGNTEELECLVEDDGPGILSLLALLLSGEWFHVMKGVILPFPLAIAGDGRPGREG